MTMRDTITATPEVMERIQRKSHTELAEEINSVVRTVRQTGLSRHKADIAKRVRAGDIETIETLEKVREAWRRLEAQGDPLGIHNGKAPDLPESLSDPNRHRKAKSLDIGYKKVGHRLVRKLLTTADRLEEEPRTKNNPDPVRHLPRHLRSALDKFCAAVAEAMSVTVEDDGPSSARATSGNGDGSRGAFGPREISDRVLDARYLWKCLEREIPAEMMDVLQQVVGEETGLLQGKPIPLENYGNKFGWADKRQAYAAGGMLAISACAVLHHAIKRGVGQKKAQGRR